MTSRKEDRFAHDRLADFIRLPLEQTITFECAVGEGAKIIQRMRVKLSKLKTKARRLRRTVREFKMLVQSIDVIGENEKVVLKKTESGVPGLLEALDELDNEFPGLTVGKRASL